MDSISNYIKNTKSKLFRNKNILNNFSFLALFQVLSLVFPLITYPYLTRVLGLELYGVVLTAQVLASYCSVLVNFGFPAISPRHISINQENKIRLSEIFSSIFTIQFILWIISFFLYITIILVVPTFREHFLLFFFSFFLTLADLLFPIYYFQGVEKMKYITLTYLIFKGTFIVLIFFLIKSPDDYVLVPILNSIGYLVGGLISLYIVVMNHKIKLRKPSYADIKYYFMDALPIFSTDVICTIKNKFNYLLLGQMLGMSSVVIYDVGEKLNFILQKPLSTIKDTIFPKMARDRDDHQFKSMAKYIVLVIFVMFVIANIFLHPIVFFLLGQEIDLLPVRVFLLAPLFVGTSSYISQCLFAARGYNRYLLYSIIFTTIAYLTILAVMFFAGILNTVTAFVFLAVISYFAELLYRMYVARKILRKEI